MRYLLASICLLFVACENKEITQLHNEVWAIHDEVMPEMKTIGKLKKQINDLLENPPANVRLNRIEFQEALEDLEAGKQDMIRWMKQASRELPDLEEEKALAYLKDQKSQISTVRDKMQSSIAIAKSLLNISLD